MVAVFAFMVCLILHAPWWVFIIGLLLLMMDLANGSE